MEKITIKYNNKKIEGLSFLGQYYLSEQQYKNLVGANAFNRTLKKFYSPNAIIKRDGVRYVELIALIQASTQVDVKLVKNRTRDFLRFLLIEGGLTGAEKEKIIIKRGEKANVK